MRYLIPFKIFILFMPAVVKAQQVRGDRYCEVVLAERNGFNVDLNIYLSHPLNFCSEEKFKKMDQTKIKNHRKVDRVLVNGPRYWVVDEFIKSKPMITKVEKFMGIDMRLAGKLTMSVVKAMSMQTDSYKERSIKRTAALRFEAGKPVYKLKSSEGKVYYMQSFTSQVQTLQQQDLKDLGVRLDLPRGWSYEVEILKKDLILPSVNSEARVVQDNLKNTYTKKEL